VRDIVKQVFFSDGQPRAKLTHKMNYLIFFVNCGVGGWNACAHSTPSCFFQPFHVCTHLYELHHLGNGPLYLKTTRELLRRLQKCVATEEPTHDVGTLSAQQQQRFPSSSHRRNSLTTSPARRTSVGPPACRAHHAVQLCCDRPR